MITLLLQLLTLLLLGMNSWNLGQQDSGLSFLLLRRSRKMRKMFRVVVSASGGAT